MKLIIILTLLLVYVTCHSDYFSKRKLIIRAEIYKTLGGNEPLSDKEQTVNNCLMQHKFKEIDYAFDNPQYFNMSHHFFDYKNKMRQSKVYKMIRRMPKGAALHLHDMALLETDYLLNLTYMEHLYVCFSKYKVNLKFANQPPTENCERWQLMSEARNAAKNVTKFDDDLKQHFTMVVDNPERIYPCITDTWTAFMNYFSTVAQLLTYRPNWEQYFYDALKKFRGDNIMYLEIRSVLPELYELDGTVYSQRVTAKSYERAINRFVKDYPDFIGAKLIFAPSRHVDTKTVTEYIQLARQIKGDIKDFFAGFDLVGQEDLGMPLLDFVPQLLEVKDLNFFFHAGETDWYGTKTDENLVDAILLGAKRIGHAYALAKHPLLMKEVVERDIGLEVNVISNEVLSLVKDVRNHPVSIFLANGLPVVLSSDDPGAWEAEPLSDDFYVTFIGASSRYSDLRLLKTLARNSLKYSSLDPVKKEEALSKYEMAWNKFIDEFRCTDY